MNLHFDIIIIGGGASGLLCAVTAKQHNPSLRVAVIEKNDRVGKKLLSTGNGRCNLTHDNISPADYVGEAWALKPVFDAIDTPTLLDRFQRLGLLTFRDSEGRYYPLSRQASAVLDVLRFHCENLGVEMFCGETAVSVKAQNTFRVQTKQNTYSAQKLVIAAGSKAAPKLGGCDSVTQLNIGHRAVPFSPALCPILVRSDILRSLKGLRAQAEVRLERGGKTLRSERGEVQFNEDNLSGICVFNLSLFTTPDSTVTLDLLPDISDTEL